MSTVNRPHPVYAVPGAAGLSACRPLLACFEEPSPLGSATASRRRRNEIVTAKPL